MLLDLPIRHDADDFIAIQPGYQEEEKFCLFHFVCVHFLPTFNLKAQSDTDSHIMNQFVFVIVLVRIKRIYEVSFVTYRSHNADVWCDVHLHADAWRHKQTKTLLFF